MPETKRRKVDQSRRIGTLDLPICKKCGKRIFKDEPRVWLTNPLGLSHEDCPKDLYLP